MENRFLTLLIFSANFFLCMTIHFCWISKYSWKFPYYKTPWRSVCRCRNDVSKQLFVFIFMVIQESIVSCKAECEANYLFLTFMKSQINQAKPSELSRESYLAWNALRTTSQEEWKLTNLWSNQSFGGQRQKTVCNNIYIYTYLLHAAESFLSS